MPDASTALPEANPPIEYAVAVWVGMPDDEIERGLREGWIRHPDGPNVSHLANLRRLSGESVLPGDREPWPSELPPREDRARIEMLLRRLDATLDGEAFAAAWNEAGENEATRSRAFTNFLARALNVPFAEGDTSSFVALENAAAGASGNARFVRLDTMNGAELEALARGDGAVRRALAMHERWALSGDRALARLGDPEGRFDRFDRDTGEVLLSDAWMGDRARHAAWRMAAARGESLEVEGDGWRFVDRAAGDDATLELKSASDSPVHQVIFARDDGDRVDGGASTDRIHGGTGNDILRGRGGEDLLEGGAGSDLLLGGGGRDQLAGGQGDDELEGGGGGDRLEGGSGNDELAGGRGDDVLRGGAGIDVYRFDEGDGADLVIDESGSIVIDDVTLAGSMRRDGAGWRSDDGRFRFALDGEGSDGAALVIHASGSGDSIRIAGWRPGAFGISLADGSQPEETPPLPEPPIGNEDGVPSPGESTDGRENGEESAASEANGNDTNATPFDWSAIASTTVDDASLVDGAALARAIDDWSPPAPPDVRTRQSGSAPGLTQADLAEALAEASDAIEAEPVGLSPFDPRHVTGLGPHPLPEPIAPPGLVIRHTP